MSKTPKRHPLDELSDDDRERFGHAIELVPDIVWSGIIGDMVRDDVNTPERVRLLVAAAYTLGFMHATQRAKDKIERELNTASADYTAARQSLHRLSEIEMGD